MALKKFPLAACLVLLTLAIGGCAGTAVESSQDEMHRVDFSAVFIEDTLDEATHEWVQLRVGRCVDLQGHPYVPVQFRPEQRPQSDSRELRKEHGYGYALASRVVENHTFQPLPPEVSEMSDVQVNAYLGVVDACKAQAEQALNDVKDGFLGELVNDEQSLFDSVRTWNHTATLEALRLWATCMHSAGYPDVNAISDVLTQASEMFNQPELLQQEVRLAVADWDCSHSDGVQRNIALAHDELNRALNDRFSLYLDGALP